MAIDDEFIFDPNTTWWILDHLMEEVHVWRICRNDAGRIENWRLVYVNPPSLRSWGCTSLAKIKNMTADEILGEGVTEHYMPVVRKIFEEQRPHSYQNYLPHLDKHFYFTSVPLGEYFITTGVDITSLISRQHEIEDDNKALELVVKKRTEMLEQTIVSLNEALEESRCLREELKQLALRDPLTDLYNRRYLEEAMMHEIHRCKRSNLPLSVIFIDVDHFKDINDKQGHETGDLVLREVAAMVSGVLRAGDVVCRYGGDEIVVILPYTPLDKAVERAEDMRAAVDNIDWQDRAVGLHEVTLSMGVAEYPSQASTWEALLKAADRALLQAKKNGRNCVCHT